MCRTKMIKMNLNLRAQLSFQNANPQKNELSEYRSQKIKNYERIEFYAA